MTGISKTLADEEGGIGFIFDGGSGYTFVERSKGQNSRAGAPLSGNRTSSPVGLVQTLHSIAAILKRKGFILKRIRMNSVSTVTRLSAFLEMALSVSGEALRVTPSR